MTFNQPPTNRSECDGLMYNPNFVPALYLLMFPVALLLNGVAAWVSLHLESTSTFVVYLKNLIAADVIMTLIIPFTAANELQHESKTLFMLSCHVGPIFYSSQYTCIGLLGLISLDRFFKIVVPQSNLFIYNLTFSKLISASIWVTLLGSIALPNIILNNKPVTNLTQISSCMSLKQPPGVKFHRATVICLNALFWIVSVVIVVCYVCITKKVIQSFRNSSSNNNRGKQRIKLRVFLVVVVFFVSFGPYHIISIPFAFQQIHDSASTDCFSTRTGFFMRISLWFATTSICMNPLLYIFLCREFKEKLASMMKTTSFSGASGGKAVTE